MGIKLVKLVSPLSVYELLKRKTPLNNQARELNKRGQVRLNSERPLNSK